MFLLVASGGTKQVKQRQFLHEALGRLWGPNVSGQITEVHLPCPHSELFQPEMLAPAWSGISAWLGPDE